LHIKRYEHFYLGIDAAKPADKQQQLSVTVVPLEKGIYNCL